MGISPRFSTLKKFYRTAINLNEIKRLPVKEIDRINLITSPGAEYNAAGRAVLEIITLYPEDGFSFQTEAEINVGHLLSHQEGIQLKWKRKRLTAGANYSFKRPYEKYKEYAENDISNSIPFFLKTTTRKNLHRNIHSFGLSSEYELNSKHLIGVYFTGENMKGAESSNSALNISDIILESQHSHLNQKQPDYFLNTFYRGMLSKHVGVNAYFDYVNNKGNLSQNVFSNNLITGKTNEAHLYQYPACVQHKCKCTNKKRDQRNNVVSS